MRGAPITPETVAVELQTRDRLLAGAPARPGRGRRCRPVRRRLRPRAARVPLRRERAGLPGGRHRAAVAPPPGRPGRHALRPAPPLAADRRAPTARLAAVDDRPQQQRRRLEPARARPGAFRSVAVHDGEPHLLVELGGRVLLERFDDALMTDHAVTLTSPTPTTIWTGLGHLEGREVVASRAPSRLGRARRGRRRS